MGVQLFLQEMRHKAHSCYTGTLVPPPHALHRDTCSVPKLHGYLRSYTCSHNLFTYLPLPPYVTLFSSNGQDKKKGLTTSTKGKNVVSVKGGCIGGLDWKAAIHIWYVSYQYLSFLRLPPPPPNHHHAMKKG